MSHRWVREREMELQSDFRPVCFALNGILVALMFTPGGIRHFDLQTPPTSIALWVSVDGANALRAIEHSSRKIIALLLQSAPTYRPENYSYLSVLEIAKPIVAISPNIKRFAYDLRFMLYLFLVQHSLIAVIYFPLFIIVLRSLRRQISPMELPEKRFVGDHTTKKRNAIDKVRKRIIKHAWCPWAYCYHRQHFLAFLIQNAWEIHKKHLKLVVAAAEIYPQLVPEGGKSHRVFESSCS
ncbi:hypothetical protein PSHT_00093 [Puccinia striiformis]|uniref:Uncharacterized protein n=1 Tax=Puccinia striiformis TaxID=27350 RepID=A0A2S4WNX8_9BASI|nr:hypothetical protein PSHT_00093 [Puccinia striiformis]